MLQQKEQPERKQKQGGGGIPVPPTDSAVLEILCIFSIVWKRKALKLCFHPQACLAQKGKQCLKEEAHSLFGIIKLQSGKATTTFTCQSICHPPHHSACQLYKSPEQRTWDLATPASSLAPTTFAAFTWFYPEPMPFSPSAPTLAKPILFPENGSPINPAGTLIDSLMFNSYYIGRKNQVSESFSRNRNSRFCDRGRENTRQACMQHCAVTESEGVLKKQGRNEVLKWATNRKSYKW